MSRTQTPRSATPETRGKVNWYFSSIKDGIFATLFLVDVAATLFAFHYIIHSTIGYENLKSLNFEGIEIDFSIMDNFPIFRKALKIALTTALLMNVTNLLGMICVPQYYVLSAIILSTIASVVLLIQNLIESFSFSLNTFFLLLSIVCEVGYFIYSMQTRRVTSAVIRNLATIVWKNPMVVVLTVALSALETLISLAFAIVYFIAFVFIKAENNDFAKSFLGQNTVVINIFFIFSFYWITRTIRYVSYLTSSSLTSFYITSHKGTDRNYPKYPVLAAFRRALTENIGSACFASFCVASVEVLDYLKEFAHEQSKGKKSKKSKKDDDDDDNDNGSSKIVWTIVYFVLSVVVFVLRKLSDYLTHYGLIYCAMDGSSFLTGCKRFATKSFGSQITVLNRKTRVNDVLAFGTFTMLIIGSFVTFGTYKLSTSSAYEFYDAMKFFSIFAFIVLFYLMNELMTTPFKSISETLQICYLENPGLLKSEMYDLSDVFSGRFSMFN